MITHMEEETTTLPKPKGRGSSAANWTPTRLPTFIPFDVEDNIWHDNTSGEQAYFYSRTCNSNLRWREHQRP